MSLQRYEYISDELNDKGKPKSAKFWIGWCEGSIMLSRFGRTGTDGSIKKKELESVDAAVEHLEKKTQEKIKKGYKPV